MKTANEFTELRLREKYDMSETIVRDKIIPDSRGRLALRLIERWGLIIAKDGGEDSAGRAKPKPMPSKEVVKAACDIAEDIFKEMKKRNWLLQAPPAETWKTRRKNL